MLTTTVFKHNLKAYNDGETLIANQGGQGSSKTISILQLLYLIALNNKKEITICSYALPHLKNGAMKDWDKILIAEGIELSDVRNKSENTYQIGKSIVTFFGIEGNEAKAHGPRRDILYINEANRKISYDVFDQLNSRTQECTFIDFNPSAEFWYHEKVMQNFKNVLIKSTFLDNPYLPDRERENILMKRNKPGFENWWRVYGEGELGKLEGAILSNWKFGEFDNTLPFGYGLDFGSRDPDAMTKVAIDQVNKKIYIKEEIYKNNLSTNSLYEIIMAKKPGNHLIVADSAGTRTILDLKNKGLNIVPVSKGEIVDDIKLLHDYELIIDPDSSNLEKELNNWIWLDKKGELPMDIMNHLIDSFRYYVHHVIKPNPRKAHRIL